MDFGLCPGEWTGGLVVPGHESIDVTPELIDVGEARALKGLAHEDREPAFHLVEPGGVGRCEVEAHVGGAGEPAGALGLGGVGVKVKRTLGWRASQRSRLGLWVLRLSRMTWISRPAWAATMRFMKSRNSTRRRRRWGRGGD